MRSNTSTALKRASNSETGLANPSGSAQQEISLERSSPAFIPRKYSPGTTLRVPWYQRAVEIAVAATVLIASSPIMLWIAFVIKRDSPGPALFTQQRVGAGRGLFSFVKFRTLYADARERFPHLYEYQYDADALQALRFKIQDDPRVTRAGNWLRQSTLDELPNFWCVLTGHMALVGPRPEIPEMLSYYHGDMLRKFDVRPGITGLAQISGRGRLGFLETVHLDVEYVNYRSFWLDLRIILKTIRGVLTRDGAF